MPWLVALTAIACSPARDGEETAFARAREEMVATQIASRGVRDPLTLAAMRKVARHLFVPAALAGQAYEDHPLPIGHGQTISQPYIVGFMTDALALKGGETVLEVGTGSGYQAAVLGEIAARVYTIEIVTPLAEEAAALLKRLGYANVEVRAGDGYQGWPEAAPFDAIIVTAAPGHVPEPLVEQLAKGGRMVLPLGDWFQDLVLVTRGEQGVRQERLFGVRFVPMTGEAERAGRR
jgi:protein-L-isoaspartate(D-aspartate) O-methyltransferase